MPGRRVRTHHLAVVLDVAERRECLERRCAGQVHEVNVPHCRPVVVRLSLATTVSTIGMKKRGEGHMAEHVVAHAHELHPCGSQYVERTDLLCRHSLLRQPTLSLLFRNHVIVSALKLAAAGLRISVSHLLHLSALLSRAEYANNDKVGEETEGLKSVYLVDVSGVMYSLVL